MSGVEIDSTVNKLRFKYSKNYAVEPGFENNKKPIELFYFQFCIYFLQQRQKNVVLSFHTVDIITFVNADTALGRTLAMLLMKTHTYSIWTFLNNKRGRRRGVPNYNGSLYYRLYFVQRV